MTFWLRSVESDVQARAGRVRADTAALATARRRFTTSLRRELARPKVLLAIFASGLGAGWLRRHDSGSRRHTAVDTDVEDAEVKTGRIAKIVAAVLAGARVYEQARRAIAFLDEHSRGSTADRRAAAYGRSPEWAGAASRGAAYEAPGDAADEDDREVSGDSPLNRRASSGSDLPSAAARYRRT